MSAVKATRNFFIEASFDDFRGKRVKKWGPAPGPEDGMELKVFMLKDGKSVVALDVKAVADRDGVLRVVAVVPPSVKAPESSASKSVMVAVGSRGTPRQRFWRSKKSVS